MPREQLDVRGDLGKHKEYMGEPPETPAAPMQLPNSIAHRGQLAGVRQPTLWYSSNPFLAVVQGIVIALLENSAPILIIPVIALAITFGLGLLTLFIAGKFPGTLGMIVISTWLGGSALVLLFAMSLHLQLMIASFHQERISVGEAFDRAIRRPLGFFAVLVTCYTLPITALILLYQATSGTKALVGGLLLLPSYFIIARLWLSAYFFYDRRQDVKLSMIDSWQLTKGRTAEMLGVMAAQVPLCIIGVFSPLVASSGFTTRYFQLRYLNSHKLESSAPVHWTNYVMTLALLLGTAYGVTWRVLRVNDDHTKICYVVTNIGYSQQVCQTKQSCRKDPTCYSRLLAHDPTIQEVE